MTSMAERGEEEKLILRCARRSESCGNEIGMKSAKKNYFMCALARSRFEASGRVG